MKISIGLVMERVGPRIVRNLKLYEGKFLGLIKNTASMICDSTIEVRRLGKKIFFKLLSCPELN